MELRAAIRFRKVVSFDYQGIRYTVEPHDLAQVLPSGTLTLEGWIRDGGPPGWQSFKYCKIKNMVVHNLAFVPREIKRGGRLTVVAA